MKRNIFSRPAFVHSLLNTKCAWNMIRFSITTLVANKTHETNNNKQSRLCLLHRVSNFSMNSFVWSVGPSVDRSISDFISRKSKKKFACKWILPNVYRPDVAITNRSTQITTEIH